MSDVSEILMRLKSTAILLLVGILSVPFSGCISPSCGDNEQCENDNDGYTDIQDDIDQWTGTTFPDFDLMDTEGINWTNENFSGELWIAYFSAVWCTHCETTFNSYDKAIPEGKFLAFNKDPREEYSNISEWKATTSERLERNITRPFLHGPTLAESLDVHGIPHAFFVNGDGMIVDYTYGVQDNSTALEVRFQEHGGILN